MYVVIFAKFAMSKAGVARPVALAGGGAYFGGAADTFPEAEALARGCVSAAPPHSRGCLLPRVFRAEPGESIIDVGYRAQEFFEALLAEMNEADEAIARSESL